MKSASYEIYLAGCTKPVWIYKHWGWVVRRLNALASEGSLQRCTIKSAMFRGGECSVWFGKDVMGNRIWEA